MAEQDDLAGNLVSAYLAETEVSAESTEAALAAVKQRIAAGGTAAATKAGLGLKLALGAGLGVAATAWGLWLRPVPAADPPGVPAAAAPVPPEPPRPAAPAPVPAASKEPGPAASPAAASPPPGPRPRRPTPPAAEGSLAAELELMRTARSALRDGDPGRALELVHRHERRYRKSPFAEERGATEVMALCALGRAPEARDEAARFRRAFPGSAFEAGLFDDCEAADDAG